MVPNLWASLISKGIGLRFEVAEFLNMELIASSLFPPFGIGSSLGYKGFIFGDPIVDPNFAKRRANCRPKF
jgi:hypothetical protein